MCKVNKYILIIPMKTVSTDYRIINLKKFQDIQIQKTLYLVR